MFHAVLALLVVQAKLLVTKIDSINQVAHLVGWELCGVANQVSKGAHQQPREFGAHSADGAVLAGICHCS